MLVPGVEFVWGVVIFMGVNVLVMGKVDQYLIVATIWVVVYVLCDATSG